MGTARADSRGAFVWHPGLFDRPAVSRFSRRRSRGCALDLRSPRRDLLSGADVWCARPGTMVRQSGASHGSARQPGWHGDRLAALSGRGMAAARVPRLSGWSHSHDSAPGHLLGAPAGWSHGREHLGSQRLCRRPDPRRQGRTPGSVRTHGDGGPRWASRWAPHSPVC